MKKKIDIYLIAPLLIILVFALLAYLGSKVKKCGLSRQDTLEISIKADPASLNPVLTSDSISIYVNSFIFNSLVKYDENMEIVPEIAKSWEILDGGKRYVFHIKEGIKWHDGVELTAYDCQATFDKLLEPSTNTFNRGFFIVKDKKIKFRATGRYTFEATLPEPFAPFLNNIALIGIMPRHVLEKEEINFASYNRSPVGTGPFKFQYWKPSDEIALVANKDYFKGAPKLEKIIFKIIPSGEGNRIALFSGEVDIANLTSEDLFVLKDKIPQQVQIYKWDDFTYFFCSLDLTNPLFSDKKIRKALNYAIDTETIIEASLHGIGSAIHGPIPIPSWAHNEELKKNIYNPAIADEMLDGAGWKKSADGFRYKGGQKFSFTLSYVSGTRSAEAAAVFIQSYLAKVGIDVRLQPLDFGALISSLYPGKYEAVIFDWVEPFDPDFYTEWHSSQCGNNGMNFMSYTNPAVDSLLEEARSTIDMEKRKKIYFEIQEKISEDAPYIFLWNQSQITGVNKRVRGLSKPSPAGLTLAPERIFKTQ